MVRLGVAVDVTALVFGCVVANLVGMASTMETMIPELKRTNVHIKNPEKVEKLIQVLVEGGKNKLQVIADFDRTLSKYKENGRMVPTCHTTLEKSSRMPDFFREATRDLFHHYYAIEIDHTLTQEEKYPYMVEWWTKAHDITLRTDLTHSMLQDIVKEVNIALREGCTWMFRNLQMQKVPLLIFSAGIGDVIEELLRQRSELFDNMKVVSNFMEFNTQGDLIGYKGELIHIYNKNENAIHNSEYFNEIKKRNNVVLLGDSLGDLTMANGIENANILKIGFLNDKIDERLATFMDLFDIVLVSDESMDIPNSILQKIIL